MIWLLWFFEWWNGDLKRSIKIRFFVHQSIFRRRIWNNAYLNVLIFYFSFRLLRFLMKWFFSLLLLIRIKQFFELLEVLFEPFVVNEEKHSENNVDKQKNHDDYWDLKFKLRLLNLICDEKENQNNDKDGIIYYLSYVWP